MNQNQSQTYASDKAIRMYLAGELDKVAAEWLIASELVDFRPEADGHKPTLNDRIEAVIGQLYDASSGTINVPSAGTIKHWSAAVNACRKAGYTGNFSGMTLGPATAYKVARDELRAAASHEDVAKVLRALPELNRAYNQARSAKRKKAAIKSNTTRHDNQQEELAAEVAAVAEAEADNPVNLEPAHEVDDHIFAMAERIATALGEDVSAILEAALMAFATEQGVDID